jgi:hypothetical protein
MHQGLARTIQPGKRIGNRLRLGVPAGFVMTHETRRCLLDDISPDGARLRMDKPLELGRAGIICFHRLRLFCSVVWRRNGECGVRFDSKVPVEDMEGFLWIVRNPKAYKRLCEESLANDWSQGIGG